MSVLVILELKLKPESVNTLKEMLPAILPDTRSFAGCQDITFYSNQDDPQVFVAAERWESKDAYQKYLAWRTETGVMAKLGSLLTAPPSIRYFDAIDA